MAMTVLWACIFVVTISAGFDLFTRRIPNTVSLGGLVIGLAIHTALGAVDGGVVGALRGFGFAFAGALACGILPFFSWRSDGMGGGDVKLLTAVGALLGPFVGFTVVTWTYVLALIVLAPYRILRHGTAKVLFRNLKIRLANLGRRIEERMPLITAPKAPAVVLGPTIGVALLLTCAQQGLFLR